MIKFGCDIKMLKTSPTGESWMLHYSEFSLEVIGGHVALIVDLEFLVDGVALGFDEVGSVGVLEL
jgi:hypothetical protein